MRIPICVKALKINQVVKNSHTIHPSKSYLRISEKKKKINMYENLLRGSIATIQAFLFIIDLPKNLHHLNIPNINHIRVYVFSGFFSILSLLPFPSLLSASLWILSSQITIKQDNTRIEKKKSENRKKNIEQRRKENSSISLEKRK